MKEKTYLKFVRILLKLGLLENKYTYFFIASMIITITLCSAAPCSDIINVSSIPCQINTLGINCSDNVFIYKGSDVSINYSIPMVKINTSCIYDCIFQFDFIYNTVASYNIELCDNITYSLINVVSNDVIPVTNNVDWLTYSPSLDLKKSLIGMSSREQLKYISKEAFLWAKEVFLMYWWILIVFIFIVFISIKKHRKGKNKEIRQ